jgi:AMMECR1 domain-containing protein
MEFLVRLLRLILPHVTPEIRDAIKDLLETLTERAKRTQNAWDDIFVELVKMILFPGE